MARITARALLEIGAVNFRADEPYTLTSGMTKFGSEVDKASVSLRSGVKLHRAGVDHCVGAHL